MTFALCNAGEALLAAGLIERHFGSGFALDRLRKVLGLLAAAAFASVISGLVGTLGFKLFHSSTAPSLTIWQHWFASDALGIVTVAPLLIGIAGAIAPNLPVVNDELALLWMVNMGCIDLNAWYSRIDKPDRPDFVLFDLDPTPDTPWVQTIEVALDPERAARPLGLTSFPKTSGGKGFHVLVPLDRRSTYDDTRGSPRRSPARSPRTHPKLATTEWSRRPVDAAC